MSANPGAKAGPVPGAVDLSALRPGEFHLTVKNPQRLVPRGLLVRARVPQVAGDAGPTDAQRQAWERA